MIHITPSLLWPWLHPREFPGMGVAPGAGASPGIFQQGGSKEGISSSKTTTWGAGEPPQAMGCRRTPSNLEQPGWIPLECAGTEHLPCRGLERCLGARVLGSHETRAPLQARGRWDSLSPKFNPRETFPRCPLGVGPRSPWHEEVSWRLHP